jgi:hypothetical protein
MHIERTDYGFLIESPEAWNIWRIQQASFKIWGDTGKAVQGWPIEIDASWRVEGFVFELIFFDPDVNYNDHEPLT